MKTKYIIFTIVLLTSFACKAQITSGIEQQIIPVEDHYDILFGLNLVQINPGDHIKDVNNVLDKYVGTWAGTYNNRNYEFRITEYTLFFDSIHKDLLLIRYKITDSNGNILVNTLDLEDENSLVIEGLYLNDSGFYVSFFAGPDSKCGQNGQFWIKAQDNNTKLGILLRSKPDIIDGSECTGDVDLLFPLTYTLFDKQ